MVSAGAAGRRSPRCSSASLGKPRELAVTASSLLHCPPLLSGLYTLPTSWVILEAMQCMSVRATAWRGVLLLLSRAAGGAGEGHSDVITKKPDAAPSHEESVGENGIGRALVNGVCDSGLLPRVCTPLTPVAMKMYQSLLCGSYRSFCFTP